MSRTLLLALVVALCVGASGHSDGDGYLEKKTRCVRYAAPQRVCAAWLISASVSWAADIYTDKRHASTSARTTATCDASPRPRDRRTSCRRRATVSASAASTALAAQRAWHPPTAHHVAAAPFQHRKRVCCVTRACMCCGVMCSAGRRVQAQNMRMTATTSAVTATTQLTAAQKSVITNNLMPGAIARLSAMLKVRVPPQGASLFASRDCESYYSSGALKGTCASYSSSLPLCLDSPAITIPVTMIAPASRCPSGAVSAPCPWQCRHWRVRRDHRVVSPAPADLPSCLSCLCLVSAVSPRSPCFLMSSPSVPITRPHGVCRRAPRWPLEQASRTRTSTCLSHLRTRHTATVARWRTP
jgi:hypothetical protein